MKKFLKTLAKKSTALFMAVVMLLTCWVFIAPTEAEAYAYNMGGPNNSSGTFLFYKHDNNNEYVKIVYPKNIYMDITEKLQDVGYSMSISTNYGNSGSYRIVLLSTTWGGVSGNANGALHDQNMLNAFKDYNFTSTYSTANWTVNSKTNESLVIDGGSTTGTVTLSGKPSGTGSWTFNPAAPADGTDDIVFLMQKKDCDKWPENNSDGDNNHVYNWSERDDNSNSSGDMIINVVIYDKSVLNTAVSNATTIYNNNSGYTGYLTSGSLDVLKTAKDTGSTTLTTRQVTQSTIDGNVTNINNAANALKFAASNTDLLAAIAEAKAIKAESDYSIKYTEATRTALETALEAAEGSSYAKGVTTYTVNISNTSTYTYGQSAYNDQVSINNLEAALTDAIDKMAMQGYTVKFINVEGAEVSSKVYPYGTTAGNIELPANSKTDYDDTYHYSNYKWPSVSDVTGNATYTETRTSGTHKMAYAAIEGNENQHQYKCGQCDYVVLQDHDWDGGKQTTAPGCTTEGVMTYECNNCHFKKTEPIEPNGHGTTSLAKYDNNQHGQKCGVCGEFVGELENHKWTLSVSYTDPTCTTPGEGLYTCSCGAEKTDVIPVDSEAHKWKDVADLGDGTHGKVCEYNSAHTSEVSAHTPEAFEDADHPVVKATCKVTGSHWERCTVCTYIEQVTDPIDSSNHVNMSDAVPNNNGTHTAKCDDCGKTDTVACYDAAPVRTAQTCTAAAYYTHTCDTCGYVWDVTGTSEADKPLGHDYTEESDELRSAATCSDAQTNWYGCSRCDANAKDDAAAADKYYTVGIALGHEASANIIALADGQHGYKCVRYGQDGCTEVLDIVDCTYENYSDNGNGTHTGTCICGNTDTAAHSMSAWASDKEEGATDGTHSRKCNDCPYTENIGCNYVEKTDEYEEPTCMEKGGRTYYCSDCGQGYTQILEKDPDNHTGVNHFDTDTAVVPTCNAPGYEGDIICECGVKVGNGEVLAEDPTNHGKNETKVDGYVEATCTVKGHTGKVVCTGCNGVITEDTNVGLDKNNHVNKTSHNGLAATCEADGYTAYETCDACGEVLGKEVLTKLGHNYNGKAVILEGDVHAYECERYSECKSTGVGSVKGDTEACSGGTASCTALAVCAKCGDTYGVLEMHVFEGGYKQLDGKDEHYRQCLNCDAYGLGTTYTVGESEACSGGTATCLDKAECALCGGEHGEPLGHDFSAAADRINQPEAGYHNYKCSRCDVYGIVENDAQVVDGKIACYDAEPVRTAQTCTEAAYYTHTCDTCGYVWVVTGTADADLALGHDYTEKLIDDAHLDKAADCENAASYWYDCSRCDKNAKNEEDTDKYTDLKFTNGNPLGHKFNGRTEYLYKATDATCTANETYYVYCTVCKKSSEGTASEETFVKYDTALEHKWEDLIDEDDLTKNLKTAATCTSAAVYYKSCSVCGAKGTETFTYGDVLGHDFTQKVMDSAHKETDANCITAATYWFDCSRCDENAKLIDKSDMTDEKIAELKYTDGNKDPNKHTNIISVPFKAPTCTEDGHSAYKYCDDCKVETEKKVTVGYEAKGHNFTGEYNHIADTDTHNRKCKVCDAYGVGTGEDAVEGATVACQFSDWTQVAGTETHSRSCICGNTQTGDCASEDNAPSCTEKATCDTCGGKFGETSGHDIENVNWTSKGDGANHVKRCNNCGEIVETEACSGGTATCEKKAVCTVCSQEYGAQPSHSYGEYADDPLRPAMCGVNKWQIATCTVCKTATIEKEVKGTALTHAMGEWETNVPATCDEEGELIRYCQNTWTIGDKEYKCDHSETKVIPADKNAHVYEEDAWQVDTSSSDCATGVRYYIVCEVCGLEVAEKYESVPHAWEALKIVYGTCTADGYIEMKCKNCGIESVFDNTCETYPNKFEETPISADVAVKLPNKGGHKWQTAAPEGTLNITVVDGCIVYIDKEATCSQTGRGNKLCTECNTYSETVTIPSLEHNFKIMPASEATCQTPGHTSYKACTNCAYTEEATKIPALGHEDANANGKCDRCGFEMYVKDDGSNSACGCMCHNDSWFIAKLIYPIVRFFWKLFKMNKTCSCGATHY